MFDWMSDKQVKWAFIASCILTVFYLAFMAKVSFSQVLHPPGSPVLPECTVASFGSTCGITEQGAMVIITDGSTGGGTECTAAASTPQKCIYDSGALTIFTGAGGASNLNDLSDVTISSPSTNQNLAYDGTKWVNSTVGAKTDLNSLDDVTITSQASGDFLRAKGADPNDWINTPLALGDLPSGSLVSTEMDDFAEWLTQINVVTAVACDGETFIRADGRCEAASFKIEYADPLEGGSDTAGIQEAVDRCPSTGCVVQLQCDQTYNMSVAVPSNNTVQVSLNEPNLWLRGCGADGTIVQYTEDSGGFSTRVLEVSADNIRISGFKLLVDDNCGDTAGEDCNTTGNASAIFVDNTIDRLLIENMVIDTSSGTTAYIADTLDGHTSYRGIWLGNSATVSSRNVTVTNSKIRTDARGIEVFNSDALIISNNLFQFNRPSDPLFDLFLNEIFLHEGDAIQILGNNFDMSSPGVNNVARLIGVHLVEDAAKDGTPGRGVLITGNTFDRFTSSANSEGIVISNWKYASITGNFFKARKICTTDDRNKGCEVNGDCSAGTCDTSIAKAIQFFDSSAASGTNSGITVTGNMFEGFGHVPGCPIQIDSSSNDNLDNVFSSNIFDTTNFTAPSTDDGFCGDEPTIRKNLFVSNLLTGQAKQCVVGRGPGSECALAMDISVTGGDPTMVEFRAATGTAQAITGGDTINADQCGSIKKITATANVTTNTTDTFTTPGPSNDGCIMHICNTSSGAEGSTNVILDQNPNFDTGGADITVTKDDCIAVGSDGVKWRQLTPLATN